MKNLYLIFFIVTLSFDAISQNYFQQSDNYFASTHPGKIVVKNDTALIKEKNEIGNAFYLELGGMGYLSANYEFALTRNSKVSAALGWNDMEVKESKGGDSNPFLLVRGMYLHLFGKGPSYFELGIGCSYALVDLRYFEIHRELRDSEWQLMINGMIGYRRQIKDGFLFRAGLTPLVANDWIYPFFGLSFGYSF